MRSRVAAWFVWGAASAIPALMIVAAGAILASTAADADREAAIETWVLDPGYEPALGAETQKVSIVCTRRRRVTTCSASDPRAGTGAGN